jgi:excinuclease ABC subunit A
VGSGAVKSIVIRGARENNLKDLSLEIPRDRLVVVTGLSGSGKSSLAFDTLYAEGQRRYVESLSAYVRQFLELQGKPDVDSIDGLSPAISIEQRTLGKNPRSTVGTITEIYDYLRLLYARAGRPHCPRCGRPVSSQSVQQIVDSLRAALPEGTRFSVLAPLCRDRKGELKHELDALRREGFGRINLDGEVRELSEELVLDRKRPHTIEVYVDRLALRPGIETRLADSLELALRLGSGVVKIAPQAAAPIGAEGGVSSEALLFSERLACVECGVSLPELTPRAFSFNNPAGACPRCSGLGVLLELDEARIVPHPELSLREGAIEPWEGRNAGYYQGLLETLAQQFAFDLFTPYAELPASVKTLLMHGSGELEVEFSLERGGKLASFRRPFEGVIANLRRRLEAEEERRRDGSASGPDGFDELVEEYRRYMRERPCPECGGARLREEARAVTLGGRPIHALTRLAVGRALELLASLVLEERERTIAARLLDEIRSRLAFLCAVGLDYLSLDRAAATLSGGEGQRVRLATQIGSALTGVLYILDEPSIGLHRRDHRRLLDTLLALRDRGNTVLVVEHDEETIRAADHIIDLGPGAGTRGGELVAAGTLAEVMATPRSLTGQFLSGARRIEVPRTRRRARRHLRLLGASANNLKAVDLELPLGVLTCVTGVSGSGKSTLIVDTLLPALAAALGAAGAEAGAHRKLEGAGALERVIAVDQAPIGRSPRSNPATYTGLFAKIRELFAELPESKARGYKPGRYSMNVKGGRCEACQGEGVLRIAMHFLPDVYVVCEVCGGRRYNRETLEVRYRGASIADVLALTVDGALELLGNIPAIRPRLEALRSVGLGYLTLGQGANTLSGGEAQRLKLSRELARASAPARRRGSPAGTLFVLDEPTSGLHLADIEVLLEVLSRLVEAGQTVVVIEHHLDVIKTADWVIDLGPEGGERGGRIIAAGTPEEVARAQGSFTGEALRPVLGL